VLIRWAWSFLTRGRATRLITGRPLLPPIETPEPPVLAPIEPIGTAAIEVVEEPKAAEKPEPEPELAAPKSRRATRR
jgi:hypothetical protein